MKVGLFIPCYVDVVYPEVGVATYKLLRHLGIDVTYPEKQTCCGQPMANAGFEKQAIPLAEKFEEKFKGFDYVVAPSVSCTAFVRLNYARLLNHECETAKRCMDVVEFLHDVVKLNRRLGTFPHKVSLHNSCHGVRELGLSSPSEEHVKKFNKINMFSIEETAICAQMGKDKVERHIQTGAEYVTGPDCSCLMHMAGVARKQGLNIQFKHVVEILAAGL